MKIRIITVGELADFIKEEAYQKLTVVPITPLRALSQFRNPVAQKTDVALILAVHDDGEILSYFGCLPDQLTADKSIKICWCTCWWTHPEKGKGTAMPVLYKALEIWKGQMLFDALPARSVAILERLNFVQFETIKGTQASLRFKLAKVLPNRFSFFKNTKSVLRLADWLLNFGQDWRMNHWAIRDDLDIESAELKRIDTATAQFIKQQNKAELIGRNETTLNWVLQYPWIDNQENGTGPYSQNYFFSAHAQHFFNHVSQVEKDGQILAVLFLTFRDGVVKMPYAYFDQKDLSVVVSYVFRMLINWEAETFICFHPQLVNAINQKKLPFFHQKEITKTFGIPKNLAHHLQSHPQIQDGDGDVVFT